MNAPIEILIVKLDKRNLPFQWLHSTSVLLSAKKKNYLVPGPHSETNVFLCLHQHFLNGGFATCQKIPWADFIQLGSHDLDPGSQHSSIKSLWVPFDDECMKQWCANPNPDSELFGLDSDLDSPAKLFLVNRFNVNGVNSAELESQNPGGFGFKSGLKIFCSDHTSTNFQFCTSTNVW